MIWSQEDLALRCSASHPLCDGWEHWPGLLVHWVLTAGFGTPFLYLGTHQGIPHRSQDPLNVAFPLASEGVSTWPTNPQMTPPWNLDFNIGI